MTTSQVRRLGAEEIRRFSSTYIAEGRKQESWRIKEVEIRDGLLSARICMESTFVSAQDPGGFHLSVFPALEFLSQLMIVYTHVWAQLPEKRRECWMVESQTCFLSAIRNSEDIRVEMTVRKMRKRGVHLYCVADYRVTDDQGGLFEASLKGFLS
jgi:hypothetical protein